MCRAVFKFQGELLQGQCLHAQAHGPRQRRGEIPPQPTSADKPMSNGTWRQDQLPAAALAARRPIRIEGSASAQAVKAQWLCTCYTWPGSNWRPSACEAGVIATRPQVLLPLVALALRCGETNMLASCPNFFLRRLFCLSGKLGHRLRASCLMLPHPPIRCQQLCIRYATTRRLASRACGVVVSHPLRMRKALGSIPSRSNCPNHSSLPMSNVT